MESPWLGGKGQRRGLVSQMSAAYGQKLLVDGQAALLLRQDRQLNETQRQPAGLLGEMAGHIIVIATARVASMLGGHRRTRGSGVGDIREKALGGRTDHLRLIAEREFHGTALW